MLRCAQFVEQVTEVEEGAAGAWTRLAFHLHRLTCRHCRRYLRQLRAVRAVLFRPDDSASPSVRPPVELARTLADELRRGAGPNDSVAAR